MKMSDGGSGDGSSGGKASHGGNTEHPVAIPNVLRPHVAVPGRSGARGVGGAAGASWSQASSPPPPNCRPLASPVESASQPPVHRLHSNSTLGSEMRFPTFAYPDDLGSKSPESDNGERSDVVSMSPSDPSYEKTDGQKQLPVVIGMEEAAEVQTARCVSGNSAEEQRERRQTEYGGGGGGSSATATSSSSPVMAPIGGSSSGGTSEETPVAQGPEQEREKGRGRERLQHHPQPLLQAAVMAAATPRMLSPHEERTRGGGGIGIQRQRDVDVVRNTNLLPDSPDRNAGSVTNSSSSGGARRHRGDEDATLQRDEGRKTGRLPRAESEVALQTRSEVSAISLLEEDIMGGPAAGVSVTDGGSDIAAGTGENTGKAAAVRLSGLGNSVDEDDSTSSGRGTKDSLQERTAADDSSSSSSAAAAAAAAAAGTTSTSAKQSRAKRPKPVTLEQIKQSILHGHPPPPCFALFGSFERARIFNELVQLCRNPSTYAFVKEVHQLTRLHDVLPGDADFLVWIENAHELPPEEYFSQPVIAWPLHTLISLACYFQTAQNAGFTTMKQVFRNGGFLSTGKGFLTAIAVALSEGREQFVMNSVTVLKVGIAVGTLYQRHADTLLPLVEKCPKQCFQLLLVNIPLSALQLLVAIANEVETEDEPHRMPLSEVQICRVISQRSCVVCGHPLDLMRLDMLLIEYANETGVKIHKDFLPAVVPENSPHYNQALPLELIHMLREEDVIVNPQNFLFPVFSPVNGLELNDSTHFMMEMAGALTCVPQDLTYSLQHLRETDTLFDFSVAELSIGQMIAWSKKSISVVAVPHDRLEVSALPSPRRSAHNHVIRSTMAKCAVINTILQALPVVASSGSDSSSASGGGGGGASMPLGTFPVSSASAAVTAAATAAVVRDAGGRRPSVTFLGSSFVDLGLLLDLDRLAEELQSPNSSITSFGHSSGGGTRVAAENVSLSLAGASLRSGIGNGGSSVSSRRQVMNPRLFSMSLSTVTPYVEPTGTSEMETRSYSTVQRSFVVLPSTNSVGIVNVFQVSPLIRYLENQHRCLLTQRAVDFVVKLSEQTRLPFPQYTLLVCPTIFALLELWDAYEFVERLEARQKQRRDSARAAKAAMGWRSQAEVRRNVLGRVVSEIKAARWGAAAASASASGASGAAGAVLSPSARHLSPTYRQR